MEPSKPRPKLKLAAQILQAEERAALADAVAADAIAQREDAHRRLAELYARWDADVERSSPADEDEDDGYDPIDVGEDDDEDDGDQADQAEGPPSTGDLPWRDEGASKAERVRRFFRAHPDAEVTAGDLEEATGVPAKNVNQVLSRGLKTPENPKGFVDRPRPGVYMLTERARAWARSQQKART